jgi:hypothetical protein
MHAPYLQGWPLCYRSAIVVFELETVRPDECVPYDEV